jgi:hypothetical protein
VKNERENWFDTCIPSEINKEVKEDYSKVEGEDGIRVL